MILGIDPGIARCGYGIVDDTTMICYGCIETSKAKRDANRLLEIYTAFSVLMKTYHPTECAIERVFFAKNISSALNVAEVRGVILLCAEQHHLSITEYTPNQVKQTITGDIRADKHQMQDAIMHMFGLPDIPKPDDAADALSVAATHKMFILYQSK